MVCLYAVAFLLCVIAIIAIVSAVAIAWCVAGVSITTNNDVAIAKRVAGATIATNRAVVTAKRVDGATIRQVLLPYPNALLEIYAIASAEVKPLPLPNPGVQLPRNTHTSRWTSRSISVSSWRGLVKEVDRVHNAETIRNGTKRGWILSRGILTKWKRSRRKI